MNVLIFELVGNIKLLLIPPYCEHNFGYTHHHGEYDEIDLHTLPTNGNDVTLTIRQSNVVLVTSVSLNEHQLDEYRQDETMRVLQLIRFPNYKRDGERCGGFEP